MPDRSLHLPLKFELDRESPFSFICKACSKCCHKKAIKVAPYEALRLARNLGITTTEFFTHYTERGGTFLKIKKDMNCIFLKDQVCTVHPDRPLVCRLFPLAQTIDEEGNERFAQMPPQQDCRGEYGKEGTVEAYLKSQKAAPYLRMEERYTALYRRMEAKLAHLIKETKSDKQAAPDNTGKATEVSGQALHSPLLDIDATLKIYCKKQGISPPVDLEEMVNLHIKSIEDWLNNI